MTPSPVLDGIEALSRHTTWVLDSVTSLPFDVGHPQGLTSIGEDWLLTTVHTSSHTGHIVRLDPSGSLIQTIDVTDGIRYHPGGVTFSSFDQGAWVATAEYRPHSTTCVSRLDQHLDTTTQFTFDDHLGAICDLGDGTLFAVSWGSRIVYRLSTDGTVLEQQRNRSHFIDYQDLQVVAPGLVMASGVVDLSMSTTPAQLGGLALIDTTDMRIVHEVPITASMPSGRSITYNGFHISAHADTAMFHCLVDDTVGAIGHWRAT